MSDDRSLGRAIALANDYYARVAEENLRNSSRILWLLESDKPKLGPPAPRPEPMTVARLMEALALMPLDAIVYTHDYEQGEMPVFKVEHDPDYSSPGVHIT